MKNEPLIFGTDGIRGHADHYPFTDEVLYKLGYAIGLWALQKYPLNQRKALIGSDTRLSGERIKQALLTGLQNFPFELVDGGILPTPAVYQLIRSENQLNQEMMYAFGIVISASHNPYHDNGIKIFDAANGKLSAHDERTIVSFFHADGLIQKSKKIDWPEAKNAYQKNMAAFFPPHFLQGIKVVLDCAHGATSAVAPDLFKSFGADVIVLHAEPDGKNINDQCGSLHPEFLRQAVIAHQAHMGFAFDGDGDRILAVTHDGTYKDGDDLLALLAQLPDYASCAEVVGTVMSNSGLEYALQKQNKTFIRTAVGDKYVAAQLEEKKLLLGGEPSGHLIITQYLPTSDAIFVALKVLEAIIKTGNWDIKTFDKFPQFLLNMPVAYKKDLAQEPYVAIIAQQQARLKKGRLLIRYSGTENILRIMAETENYQDAYDVVHELARQIQEAFKLP